MNKSLTIVMVAALAIIATPATAASKGVDAAQVCKICKVDQVGYYCEANEDPETNSKKCTIVCPTGSSTCYCTVSGGSCGVQPPPTVAETGAAPASACAARPDDMITLYPVSGPAAGLARLVFETFWQGPGIDVGLTEAYGLDPTGKVLQARVERLSGGRASVTALGVRIDLAPPSAKTGWVCNFTDAGARCE